MSRNTEHTGTKRKVLKDFKKKVFIICGSMVIIALLGFIVQGYSRPTFPESEINEEHILEAEINEKYNDYRENAEMFGWEVEEITVIDSEYGYADAFKYISDEEGSVLITADFYSNKEDYELEVEFYTGENDSREKIRTVNENLIETQKKDDEGIYITAFKENVIIDTTIIENETQKAEVYALLDVMGINIESDELGNPITEEEVSEIKVSQNEGIKMYELTNIEYVKESGESEQVDFIPGSEVFIFSDESLQEFEYRYKQYPTYDDMLADSNYDIKSTYGIYTVDPDTNTVSLLSLDGGFRMATIEGDKLIIEMSDPENAAVVRGTYTETDRIGLGQAA